VLVALTGRIVAVTGGTQGVGEGVARHAREAGAAGLVLCGRDRARGEAVAADLSGDGVEALFVRADLADPAACRTVVARCLDRFGRIDGLVNAAGITDRGGLLDCDAALWDRLFAVNARAPFLLMQDAARAMREAGGGAIVNILSMNAHCGPPALFAYSASKGALLTATRNAANALLRDRIRVNGIAMGWADTPNEHAVQARESPHGAAWLDAASAAAPFGRLLNADDVARLATYLLSPASEPMTGAIIDYEQYVAGAPPHGG